MDTSTEEVEPPETPEEKGERSVSGHMPNPESDDSVDKQTEKVGLYKDSDDEAKPVDVAGEVAEAERSRRGG